MTKRPVSTLRDMDKSVLKNPLFWAIALLFGAMSSLTVAIFFVEFAEENDVGQAARTTGPWVGGLVGLVIATLTGMYVVATQAMARATAELAEETRKAREAASRPVVVAELEADRSHVFFLVIRNIGNEVAREFRISCNPDFVTVSGKKLSELPLFNKGLPTLAPGAHIRTMLEFAPRILSKPDVPLQYVIRLSYKEAAGLKLGPFEFPIDFEAFSGLVPGQDPMKDLISAVRELRDELRRDRP